MKRLLEPRGHGARRAVPGAGLALWLAALVFSASPAFSDPRFNTEKLQFDEGTAAIIDGITKRKAAVKPPPELLAPATEADRVAAANTAIEDALRASGVPVGAPRDIEREYREVLATEVRALGAEADLLDPVEDELDGDTVPDPLDLPPRPRRTVQTIRGGLDHYDFEPTGQSPITTDVNYAEYRLQYESQPAPKTRVKLDSSLFESTARQSGIGAFNVDHRFDRHYTGSIGGTAIVERWADPFGLADNLLGSGFASVVLHLPEQLDLSLRHTFVRRTLDQPTLFTPSTRNHRTEFRIEKRMHGGTARFAYVDHQLDAPDDPGSELAHNIVVAGYTAPILKKVDVDYAFIRTSEERNFDAGSTGDFIQYNNQINVLWRFSHWMNLSFDIDTEDRDYSLQDATFVSYRRTLLAPTFNIRQNRFLAYSLGYATEIYNHTAVPVEFGFSEDELDFHTERYTAGLSFQKKRVTALANVSMSPTTYKRPFFQQSASRTYTSAGTLFYDFDDRTRATVAFSRVSQEFEVVPADNASENVTAELSRAF